MQPASQRPSSSSGSSQLSKSSTRAPIPQPRRVVAKRPQNPLGSSSPSPSSPSRLDSPWQAESSQNVAAYSAQPNHLPPSTLVIDIPCFPRARAFQRAYQVADALTMR